MKKYILENEKKSGFTLIELLIVTALIAMLVSVVTVYLKPAQDKARDSQRRNELRQIKNAMEMCYGEQNCSGMDQYPDTSPGRDTMEKIDPDGNPLYLSIPRGYTWTDGTSTYYCVYAKLEAEADTYVCASNKGLNRKTAASYTPSNSDCCGIDVTVP